MWPHRKSERSEVDSKSETWYFHLILFYLLPFLTISKEIDQRWDKEEVELISCSTDKSLIVWRKTDDKVRRERD